MPPSPITVVGTSRSTTQNATSLIAPLPGGLVDGDLVVAVVAVAGTTALFAPPSAPFGGLWVTLGASSDQRVVAFATFYRTGDPPSATFSIFGPPTVGGFGASLIAFRGATVQPFRGAPLPQDELEPALTGSPTQDAPSAQGAAGCLPLLVWSVDGLGAPDDGVDVSDGASLSGDTVNTSGGVAAADQVAMGLVYGSAALLADGPTPRFAVGDASQAGGTQGYYLPLAVVPVGAEVRPAVSTRVSAVREAYVQAGGVLSIDLPGPSSSGDVLVAFVQSRDSGDYTVTPAGWTELAVPPALRPAGDRSWIGYRVDDGAQVGPYSWDQALPADRVGFIVRVTDVGPGGVVDTHLSHAYALPPGGFPVDEPLRNIYGRTPFSGPAGAVSRLLWMLYGNMTVGDSDGYGDFVQGAPDQRGFYAFPLRQQNSAQAGASSVTRASQRIQAGGWEYPAAEMGVWPVAANANNDSDPSRGPAAPNESVAPTVVIDALREIPRPRVRTFLSDPNPGPGFVRPPPGAQAGDLLVACVLAYTSLDVPDPIVSVSSPGWTVIPIPGRPDSWHYIEYDGVTQFWPFTPALSADMCVIVFAIEGADNTAPIHAVGVEDNTGDATHDAPAVLNTLDNVLALYFDTAHDGGEPPLGSDSSPDGVTWVTTTRRVTSTPIMAPFGIVSAWYPEALARLTPAWAFSHPDQGVGGAAFMAGIMIAPPPAIQPNGIAGTSGLGDHTVSAVVGSLTIEALGIGSTAGAGAPAVGGGVIPASEDGFTWDQLPDLAAAGSKIAPGQLDTVGTAGNRLWKEFEE